MFAIPASAFVVTESNGNQCVKLDRTAAMEYYQHRRAVGFDELVRRRALANDIFADPPAAESLFNWKPPEGDSSGT